MNASDAGINDRVVVQDVIKEMAASKSIHASSTLAMDLGESKSSSSSSSNYKPQKQFKVLLLMEVDRLTKQAQAALRRTMEKYTTSCRLILYCTNPTKVIEPVRSRCLGIRIPAPSFDEVGNVLQAVAKKENLSLPERLAYRIARASGRNMRRAVLMFEATRVEQYPFTEDQQLQMPDWELYISQMAKEIIQEQSPQKLLRVREMLYDLLTNCIPPDVIMKVLVRELNKSVDEDLKHEVIHLAAFYEHRTVTGSKEIFHLEAFVAKLMSVYKQWLIAEFGGM